MRQLTTDNRQPFIHACLHHRPLYPLAGGARRAAARTRRQAPCRHPPLPRLAALPHFSREALEISLPERGIEYVHIPELGGRRKPAAGSPNTALQNEQFRTYADHMATEEFRQAVDHLLAGQAEACPTEGINAAAQCGTGFSLSGDGRTAVMCAEAVPWRCHRNLLSDELLRRGCEVVHIIGRGAAKRHVMSPYARVIGDHVVYPGLELIPPAPPSC